MIKQTSNVSEIIVSYYPVNGGKPIVRTASDAYLLFWEFFPPNTIHLQESFFAMYLNRCNRVIGVYPVAVGGITGTIADIRLILSVALKTVATSIVIAHNHPSGSIQPSQADIEVTIKLNQAAKGMDIRLMDHIILSPEQGEYFSFADERILC